MNHPAMGVPPFQERPHIPTMGAPGRRRVACSSELVATFGAAGLRWSGGLNIKHWEITETEWRLE